MTLLGIVAGLILFVSLAVHFSTFLPSPTISVDKVWPIHVAISIPFGVMVLILALQRQTARKSFREILQQTNEEANKESDRIGRIVHAVPLPILLVGIALSIYAIANFFAFMVLNPEGAPVDDNGRYYLSNHGTLVRELTEDEYHQHQAYEVRGLSGHWMVFSYAPFAYFLFIHNTLRDEAETPASA